MIALIDRVLPGGPNCYRRALFESALDGSAAREQVRIGLVAGMAPESGHVWFPTMETPRASYDVVFSL